MPLRKILILFLIVALFTSVAATQMTRQSRTPSALLGHFGMRINAGGAFSLATPDDATPDIQSFRGGAVGTSPFFGNAFIQFNHKIDKSATPYKVLEGTFTVTAANGDTISGVYRGVASPVSPAHFSFMAAEWTITAGTGRFADIQGRGLLSATLGHRENGGLMNIEFFGPMIRLTTGQ